MAPTSSFTLMVAGCPIVTRLPVEVKVRKPVASTSSSYEPGCTASKMYVPVADVFVSKVTCIPSLISLTVTPGTTAPVASCTVPRTREVVPWAKAAPQAHRNSSTETPFLRITEKDIKNGAAAQRLHADTGAFCAE